jgi:hypothetical protein
LQKGGETFPPSDKWFDVLTILSLLKEEEDEGGLDDLFKGLK